MKTNEIKFEILEDGTITVVTDDLTGANHVSADKLLKQMFELAGGSATARKRTRIEVGHAIPVHRHADGTVHAH